jgi:hypothetical protein
MKYIDTEEISLYYYDNENYKNICKVRIKFFVIYILFTIYIMSWVQVGQDINGEAVDDNSGFSVSLSSNGNRVAIGAIGNDTTGSNAGHVRVYDLSGNIWTKVGLDINGEAADDNSGYSVSLSSDGNRVAIGANNNDGNGSNAGHVRVYDLSGNIWTKVGLDIDGQAASDNSGFSVSLSSNGNRVAIGATGNDGNVSNSGHVRVYDLSGNIWTKVGQDINGEAVNDNSGFSVSLSSNGNRVAIGATGNDGNNSLNSGHVRVYDLSGNIWTQVGLDIDGQAASDNSGRSVSLSSNGNRLAIGAINNDENGSNSGHVRVYDLIGNTWTKVGQDINGEAADDNSGFSVSLSSNGNRVAIGARLNDENGSDSGHVRVYDLIGNTWIQLGLDIDGESDGDFSGRSVSLSSDGNRVAIGANLNDATGSNAGHVRVYDFVKPQPTLSNFTIPSKTFGDASFALVNPTSNSTGSFSYISSNTSVATISGNTVTIVGVGITAITSTQAATTNYTSGNISATLIVAKANAAILKEQGYTSTQLKNAGYNANELKNASYTLSELKTGGFTTGDLKGAGFTLTDLKDEGFTLKEFLRDSNFTPSQLKSEGFAIRQKVVTSSSTPPI